MATNSRQSTLGLILVPSIITLAITILRVVGERQHWSKTFFNPAAGGGFAIIGITWLPIIFGIYFAVKLIAAGDQTAKPGKAILLSVLGVVVVIASAVIASKILGKDGGITGLLITLGVLTIVALLQVLGWSGLFKTLLAYGIAARIPVLIVMYLAMQGHWGTHYDVLPPNSDAIAKLPMMSQYFDIAILPQLFLWIPFTILVGSFFGGIAGLFKKPKR